MVIDVLRDIVSKPIPVGRFEPSEKLGLSSFASVQMMMALEEHFEVEFPDDSLGIEIFRSRSSMVRLLELAGVPQILDALKTQVWFIDRWSNFSMRKSWFFALPTSSGAPRRQPASGRSCHGAYFR